MVKERFLEYEGVLTIPDTNMNELTYILGNYKEDYEFNLTKYLKENQGKRIALVINKYGKDIFNEDGIVEVISEVLMVNGKDVSNALWNNNKRKLSILIDTAPDAENMEEES